MSLPPTQTLNNGIGSADSPSVTAHGSSPPTDSKGWDGKLRVERRPVLVNPEALSDPEYSDEDAPPPEEIDADEGVAVEGRRVAIMSNTWV